MAAAAIAMAVVCGACSPEGGVELGQATSDDRIDPCALLTVAEINDVTGWSLPAGERPRVHESDGQAVCNWEDHRAGLVHLQLYEGDGVERYEEVRIAYQSTNGVPAIELDGADSAFFSAPDGLVGVLVGDRFLQVATWGSSLSEAEHVALAQSATGGL